MPLFFALILALISNHALAASGATNSSTNFVSAQPPATNSQATAQTSEKPSFAVETTITILISIATTIITSWFQERGRKRQMLQKEFTDAIGELRQFSEDISQQVLTHLTANPFSSNRQKTSHSTILVHLKLCGNRMVRAADLLNKSDQAQLEAAFLKWKSELTGAPFPVHKKEFVCQPHESSIRNIHSAQEVWNTYLCRVTRECMNGELTIPLNHKK